MPPAATGYIILTPRESATAEAAYQKSLSCQTLGEMDKDVPRGKRDSDTVPRRWHCASDKVVGHLWKGECARRGD